MNEGVDITLSSENEAPEVELDSSMEVVTTAAGEGWGRVVVGAVTSTAESVTAEAGSRTGVADVVADDVEISSDSDSRAELEVELESVADSVASPGCDNDVVAEGTSSDVTCAVEAWLLESTPPIFLVTSTWIAPAACARARISSWSAANARSANSASRLASCSASNR
jgi:hypothetical protein